MYFIKDAEINNATEKYHAFDAGQKDTNEMDKTIKASKQF